MTDMLRCPDCGSLDVPALRWSGQHVKASCRWCGTYIKFVPQTPEVLQALEDQPPSVPTSQLPLFNVEASG